MLLNPITVSGTSLLGKWTWYIALLFCIFQALLHYLLEYNWMYSVFILTAYLVFHHYMTGYFHNEDSYPMDVPMRIKH